MQCTKSMSKNILTTTTNDITPNNNYSIIQHLCCFRWKVKILSLIKFDILVEWISFGIFFKPCPALFLNILKNCIFITFSSTCWLVLLVLFEEIKLILFVYLVVTIFQRPSEALTLQFPLSSLQPFQQRGSFHQQVSHLLAGAAQTHLPQVFLSQHFSQFLTLGV